MDSTDQPPFTEGSVWSIQFARTKPRSTSAYLKHLGETWKPIMEEAQRRDVILSYRVLLSNLTSPDDWDVMVLIELKNMAALDDYREKMRRVIDEVGGGGGCFSFLEPGSEYMRLVREVNWVRGPGGLPQ
jgi:hypothetical protein